MIASSIRNLFVDRTGMEENSSKYVQNEAIVRANTDMVSAEVTKKYAAIKRTKKHCSEITKGYIGPETPQKHEIDQLTVKFDCLGNEKQMKRWSTGEKVAMMEAFNLGLKKSEVTAAVNAVEGNSRTPDGVWATARYEMTCNLRIHRGDHLKMRDHKFDEDFIDKWR